MAVVNAMSNDGRTSSAIETTRTTASNTVFPERFYGLFLDDLVASQTGKVEARQVDGNLARRRQFGLGAVLTDDDWRKRELVVFLRSQRA